MRRIFTNLSLFLGLLAAPSILSAQETGSRILHRSSSSQDARNSREVQLPSQANRATTCGYDTLLYPYLKELVFMAPNDSFFVDAMVGTVRTASQGYPMTGTVTVHGVQFWGGAYSTSTAPQTLLAKAYLYAVDANFMPTSILDSGTVTITQNYDFYEAIFATPYTVTGNFAVGVKSVLNDTLAVITNNADNVVSPVNYGEGLGWRRFGSGVWNSAASFFGQDLEYMIFPIVTYDINAAFTSSATTVCQGETVTFTNTSSNLLGDRVVNLLAFDDYWYTPIQDSTSSWNYGTSSSWSTSENGSHTYTSAGVYPATLSTELIGYYNTCLDSAMTNITVNPVYNNSTSAAICNGESMMFGSMTLTTAGVYTQTFQSVSSCDSTVTLTLGVDNIDLTVNQSGTTLMAMSGMDSYQWIDCNTNTAIAGANTSSFTASVNGSYAAYIVNGACSDTTACFAVTSVGVQENASDLYRIYPNPTNGEVNVTFSGQLAEKITIYNVLGEVVSETNPSSVRTVMSFNNAQSGVYFISIQYKDSNKVTRLIKK